MLLPHTWFLHTLYTLYTHLVHFKLYFKKRACPQLAKAKLGGLCLAELQKYAKSEIN